MPRKRTIYQSQALYVGPTPATGFHFVNATGANLVSQLHRVQSANYSFNVARQNVTQFGQLAPISREIVEASTVSLDFSYLVTNVYNESLLGFTVDGTTSAVSGIISAAQDEKNYFIEVVTEGSDAAAFAGGQNNRSVISVGNGFISNYSVSAAVGGFPTASVSVEGLNIKFDVSGSGVSSPAVDPSNGLGVTGRNFTLPQGVSGLAGQVSALRPGDITVNITGGIGTAFTDLKVQNFSFALPLSRETVNKLGTRFAFAKTITFPINATLSIDAQIGDLQSGNLADLLCNDNAFDLDITLFKPTCTGAGTVGCKYFLKGAKIDSENFQNSIGPNGTVSMQWSVPINGPQDLGKGFFVSGSLI